MRPATLDLLACPICQGSLYSSGSLAGEIESGCLICSVCSSAYHIEDGIPHFISLQSLSGLNRRFARMYDWFSWIYPAFSRLAFAYIGMSQETGRREITDRLEPHGGRVLEISIGPGVNLPYLVNRPDVGQLFGLDISIGQLRHCRKYLSKKGWTADLFLGNGEHLPFKDGSFDAVFHVGGINFFNNKQAAINEMVRVAAPGTRILIADETEKGAQGYEKFLPGFKKAFGSKRTPILPPIDLVPPGMQETRLFNVWKGWLYCIEFRKPL
jgi:ubiquinone/menaquinone biosynthesis C-methylase UbiE/uncharacterized protein YbaR (Trm112 family)